MSPEMREKQTEYIRGMLALNIRAMREHLGMSQAALAKRIGVHKHTILRIEVRDYSASFADIFLICEVFGITTDEIMKPLDIEY